MSDINPDKTNVVWRLRDVLALVVICITCFGVYYFKANYISKSESEAVHASLDSRISKVEVEMSVVREVNNLRLKSLEDKVSRLEVKIDRIGEEIRAMGHSLSADKK